MDFISNMFFVLMIFIIWGVGKFIFRFLWNLYQFNKYKYTGGHFRDTKSGKPLTDKQVSNKMEEFFDIWDDEDEEE